MIWHPKRSQRVELRYNARMRLAACFHGRTGTVRTVARGPKMVNVEVVLDRDREVVIVPRGNLRVVT
jgi:ribosomal protein L21E